MIRISVSSNDGTSCTCRMPVQNSRFVDPGQHRFDIFAKFHRIHEPAGARFSVVPGTVNDCGKTPAAKIPGPGYHAVMRSRFRPHPCARITVPLERRPSGSILHTSKNPPSPEGILVSRIFPQSGGSCTGVRGICWTR